VLRRLRLPAVDVRRLGDRSRVGPDHSGSTLPDIEKATLRLVAIRESRNLSSAAARLGMAPVSLSRWIGRRKLPMHAVT